MTPNTTTTTNTNANANAPVTEADDCDCCKGYATHADLCAPSAAVGPPPAAATLAARGGRPAGRSGPVQGCMGPLSPYAWGGPPHWPGPAQKVIDRACPLPPHRAPRARCRVGKQWSATDCQ